MLINKFIKKLFVIPQLIKNEGLDAFYWRILKNLGVKLNYYSSIEKRKYILQKKIIKTTQSKVIDGHYKGLFLNCNNDRGSHDFSSTQGATKMGSLNIYRKIYGYRRKSFYDSY